MKDMRHDEMLDLVSVYALGALGSEQARFVTAHLATCEECRAEYQALRPAADALAHSADDRLNAVSCPQMKARTMQAVAADATTRSRPRRSQALVWTSVLALAAAFVMAFFAATAERRLYELGLARANIYAVDGGEILKTPRRVYLVMRTLPPPPNGRVYQAWTLAPGAKSVAPSITFVPDARGFVIVSLPESASAVAAVAVSIEPPGGSRAQTTKPLFVRSLS